MSLPVPASPRRVSLRPALWIVAACLGTAAHASEQIERTMSADPRGEVQIVSFAGEIRVQGWERSEVQIRGELGGGVRLDVGSTDGRTSITVTARRPGSSADLQVTVPRGSTLSVNTVSADQIIEELRGAQRLQSISGTITTAQWLEDLEAKTISGDVVIRAHGGTAQTALNTVSGAITLIDGPTQFAVETVTGDMTISVAELVRGRIRNTNGDLKLTARLAREGRLDAEAMNGDLAFMLREPLNAQFDVQTFNGTIDNCFGPKPVRAGEHLPGTELRFAQGAGEARVRVKTLNGDIDICKE